MEKNFAVRSFKLLLISMYVHISCFFGISLTVFVSATTVVMTVIAITVISTVRTVPSTAVSVRAPQHRVAKFMPAGESLPHVGRTSAGRLVTKEGANVVPRNPYPVRPVKTAAGRNGMKRMTDMTIVLPGTLTATRATGKLTRRVT